MEQRTVDPRMPRVREHEADEHEPVPVDVGQIQMQFLGQKTTIRYSATVIAYAILVMRLVIGWIFLQAGLTKLTAGDWTASGFLTNAVPEGNPFTSFWASVAGSSLIDFLNIWGAIAIGIGLILGLFFRWSAFWGAMMMLFYWAASLQGGIAEGLPLEHGWIVDDHIVYVALLFGLGAIGAGRIFGLDAVLENSEVVAENPWLRLFLG